LFEDLTKTTETKEQYEEAKREYLDNLQWQAVLTFTLYLDEPEHGNHGYDEARDYILLILSCITDIKSGKHSDDYDYDSIDKLEAQLERWEEFYNSYFDDEEDEEDCNKSLMEQVDEIMIQAGVDD
jgi:hypothetical protein